jgi:hypothetical protein
MEKNDKLGQILLVNDPKDVVENDDVLVEINGNSLCDRWSLLDEFSGKLRSSRRGYWCRLCELRECLDDPNLFVGNGNNGRVYIHITDADKILPEPVDNYLKYEFFSAMAGIRNNRVFILLDKFYRDSLEECLDTYECHRDGLETENVIRRRQMLFVEKLEDIRLVRDEFFATVDGKHCSTLKDLYDELSTKLNFRKGWGRNLSAVDDCMNEFVWSDVLEDDKADNYSYYSHCNNLTFVHFKNAREILPNNDFERSAFFNTLNTLGNINSFMVIDKSDMDFVLGEAERYRSTEEEEMRIWRLEEEQKKKAATDKNKIP